MKLLKTAVVGLALYSASTLAEDCVAPDAPQIPDGATSTMEQMLAGQKAVKAFQAANIEYMGCLESGLSAAEAALKDAAEDDQPAAKTKYDSAVEAYNSAVSKEEEVAGQFNTEIREYKAANPG
jgi:hypothetical protein